MWDRVWSSWVAKVWLIREGVCLVVRKVMASSRALATCLGLVPNLMVQ